MAKGRTKMTEAEKAEAKAKRDAEAKAKAELLAKAKKDFDAIKKAKDKAVSDYETAIALLKEEKINEVKAIIATYELTVADLFPKLKLQAEVDKALA